MAREIRITIDDDEVFERLKRRKEALDLTWEEVLRRGVRHPGGVNVDLGRMGRIDVGPTPDVPGRDPWPSPAPPDDFGERLSRRIHEQVRSSLEPFGGPYGAEDADEFEDDLADLSEAEDAVLAFGWIEGEGAQVPLRVNLRTGAGGLDVEVVAVRRGKAVAGTNSFPPGARRRIAERLARGDTAVLRLGEGETYPVRPVLSWSTDVDGNPTVTDVAIDEVDFDG